jgi:hypothetical protein
MTKSIKSERVIGKQNFSHKSSVNSNFQNKFPRFEPRKGLLHEPRSFGDTKEGGGSSERACNVVNLWHNLPAVKQRWLQTRQQSVHSGFSWNLFFFSVDRVGAWNEGRVNEAKEEH